MSVAFENAVVGRIEVKNRFVRSATFEGSASNGMPGEDLLDQYRELCEGEVGLIITGYMGFSQTDNNSPKAIVLTDDSIPSLKEVTGLVHGYGTKIVAQINHTTSQLFFAPQKEVYGPSEAVEAFNGLEVKAFSVEQIKAVVAEFGAAALCAKNAGFDGVQIHGAHGYLLSRFLSPAFNKRTDEYGGSRENRMRIIVEMLQETKRQCGEDYPVWIKLNCSDFQPDELSYSEEDFLYTAERLAKSGIDAIEVSGGGLVSSQKPSRSKKFTCYHLDSAQKATSVADCSVIVVGGVRELDRVDSIIQDTQIDAVALSRPLIREPHLVKRWGEGDRSNATCVACNGCYNPNGTRCFFNLTKEEKEQQKIVLERLKSVRG